MLAESVSGKHLDVLRRSFPDPAFTNGCEIIDVGGAFAVLLIPPAMALRSTAEGGPGLRARPGQRRVADRYGAFAAFGRRAPGAGRCPPSVR